MLSQVVTHKHMIIFRYMLMKSERDGQEAEEKEDLIQEDWKDEVKKVMLQVSLFFY